METLPDRENRSRGHSKRKVSGKAGIDQNTLEVFHDAVVLHDEHKWSLLQSPLHTLLAGWMKQHPQQNEARRFDSEENYIAKALATFWETTTRTQELQLDTITSTLRFLQVSLNAVIIETLRTYSRPTQVPFPPPTFSTEKSTDDANKLWGLVSNMLSDERESRLAYLLFNCGLEASEVVQLCPDEFSDESEVSRLRLNIMKRLLLHADKISEYQAQSLQIGTETAQSAESSGEMKALALVALARATLEDENRAFVGKLYVVLAGIAQSKPEHFEGKLFSLPVDDIARPLLFDVLLHISENIELTAPWYKRLLYDPRKQEPQLVEFTLRTTASGPCSLAIDFYHERRWLRTIRLEFDAVEQSQFTTVSSGV